MMILHGSKKKSNITAIHNESDKKVTEPLEIENAFNNYFSKISLKIAAQIEDTGQTFEFSNTSLNAPKTKTLILKRITVMDILL